MAAEAGASSAGKKDHASQETLTAIKATKGDGVRRCIPHLPRGLSGKLVSRSGRAITIIAHGKQIFEAVSEDSALSPQSCVA